MSLARSALLQTARAGMEMSWRYAWAGFLTIAVVGRALPPAGAAAALAVSALVSRWLAARSWRLYQALLLRLAGFLLSALLVVFRMWRPGLGDPASAPPWYVVVFVLACLFLVWRGGRALVRDPKDHVQFDRGVGMLVLLLLVKLVADKQAGVLLRVFPAERSGLFFVAAFFIFGLVSMGLVRDRGGVERSFRPGFRGVGIVLTVSAVVVLFASGLTLLVYPHLIAAADALGTFLGAAAGPLGRVLVAVLGFLFAPKKFRNLDPIDPGSSAPGVPALIGGAGQTVLTRIIGFGLVGAIGLLALGVVGVLIAQLARLLLRRNRPSVSRPLRAPWRALLLRLLALLARLPGDLWGAVCRLLGGLEGVCLVYGSLLRWGRRSGLPPGASETPNEYAARLSRRFPRLRADIGLIADAFNREVYGEIPTRRAELARLLWARRRLRSPRHWPARLRAVFAQ